MRDNQPKKLKLLNLNQESQHLRTFILFFNRKTKNFGKLYDLLVYQIQETAGRK